MSGGDGEENGVFGDVSRVRVDTSKGVVWHENELIRELRSYTDITKGKY